LFISFYLSFIFIVIFSIVSAAFSTRYDASLTQASRT
jgi:hypothetical protein